MLPNRFGDSREGAEGGTRTRTARRPLAPQVWGLGRSAPRRRINRFGGRNDRKSSWWRPLALKATGRSRAGTPSAHCAHGRLTAGGRRPSDVGHDRCPRPAAAHGRRPLPGGAARRRRGPDDHRDLPLGPGVISPLGDHQFGADLGRFHAAPGARLCGAPDGRARALCPPPQRPAPAAG